MKLERQKSALDRLEKQLEKGIKPFSSKQEDWEDKDVHFDNYGLPEGLYLTAKDKERIKKEIEILKSKI